VSSGAWTRPRGNAGWDAVLRGTAAVAVVTIAASLLWDDVARLAAFALVTVWVHGPVSPLLPAAYEPTLLYFGRLYPPLVIATIGTVCNLWIEGLDYMLLRRLAATRAVAQATRRPALQRALALFNRRPFFTVWLFAWSPLPDWIVRCAAPAAGYPLRRYLLATMLGRFPRFWFLAALGAHFALDGRVLAAVAAAASLVMVAVLLRRRAVALRRPRSTTPAPIPSAG
jgi:uncharacterized membrane protein YdjX (TVP38/TMEM64 family)